MTVDLRRIRAVAAALRGIRERVVEHAEIGHWDTTAYDNAIGLLDGVIEDADFTNHTLDEPQMVSTDYLVHLDSMIAFLEVYEKDSGGSVLHFVPRQQS
jgi:hypothetical protein